MKGERVGVLDPKPPRNEKDSMQQGVRQNYRTKASEQETQHGGSGKPKHPEVKPSAGARRKPNLGDKNRSNPAAGPRKKKEQK